MSTQLGTQLNNEEIYETGGCLVEIAIW